VSSPLDTDPELTADWPTGSYVHVEPRADGDWGVQLRGANHAPIFTNNEGWQDLGYTLRMCRRELPGRTIVIHTADGAADTILAPSDPLPGEDR
jgi:hypothetical protein